MALNGAILSLGAPVLVTHEKLFYEQDNVDLEYESGQGYPGQGHHYFCQAGKLYLTNIRIVYVAHGDYTFFKNMNIPLMNLSNGEFIQPWWDANRYQGSVEPIVNGGLNITGNLKLIFKSGGGFEFSSIFLQLRARISDSDPFEESLPLYQESPNQESSTQGQRGRLHVVPLPIDTREPPDYDQSS